MRKKDLSRKCNQKMKSILCENFLIYLSSLDLHTLQSSEMINDTLKLNIGGYDSLIMCFKFDTIDEYCDFQEIKFMCNQCVEKHINDLLNFKFFHWKKISENKYLSNWYSQTELVIQQNEESNSCLIMRFYLIKKPRIEYRKYYKSLNGG
jgi:hypothetical protein